MRAGGRFRTGRAISRVAEPTVLLTVACLAILLLALAGADRFADGRIWDWGHFFYAADALAEDRNPYDAGINGYIYPVFFAWLLQPLTGLGLAGSATVAILMSGLGAMASMFLIVNKLNQLTTARIAAISVFVSFVMISDKLAACLKTGQTDIIILFGLAASLALVRQRPVLAGLALGFAAALKYHALIFVVLFVIRRQWRAAAVTAISFVLFMLLPAVTLGWGDNAEYLRSAFGGVVRMLTDDTAAQLTSSEGRAAIASVTWERSISVTSALARFSAAIGMPRFGFLLLTAFVAGVWAISLWLGYRAAGHAPLAPARAESDPARAAVRDLCDWSVIATAILVLAPQTTGRHFLYAWIPLAALVLAIIFAGPGRRRILLIAGCAAFFIALYLPLSDYPDLMDGWRSIGAPSWILLALTSWLPRLLLPVGRPGHG